MTASAPTFTVALLLAAIAWNALNLLKYTRGLSSSVADDRMKAKDGVVTILLGSLIGVGLVFLIGRTQWADEITVGRESLATLNPGGKVLLGVAFLSLASTLYDFKKALDNNGDSRTPGLASGKVIRTPKEMAARSGANAARATER